jgi:hypothetical protein
LNTEYTFTARLSVLLAACIALTFVDGYIPHEWTPVRLLIAVVEFAFMAACMTMTMREVLKDY